MGNKESVVYILARDQEVFIMDEMARDQREGSTFWVLGVWGYVWIMISRDQGG